MQLRGVGAAGGFATPDDFVDGFRAAMLTAAGLSALGAVVGLTLPVRRANALHDDPEPPGSVGSGSLEGAAA